MIREVGEKREVVLTKPLSCEGDSNAADYRAPNLGQRILSLLSNIRPGSDLTRMQLPAIFNLPKSHLQCYGESVYCVGNDMLSKCNKGESSLERFTSVVAWSISTTRPVIIGSAPYNPILGETHHASRGNLNVLLEQISHHPPVSALHATDEKENLEITWCQYPDPKFNGTSVETVVHGKRELKLHNHNETYEMNSPKLYIRILPIPCVDWVGNVRIRCHETDLEAELCFKTNNFLGFGGQRSIRGKIYQSSSMKALYEIDGHWDRTVTVKDVNSGKRREIYNAKEVVYGLKTPTLRDSKQVWETESAVVWSEVSKGILKQDWEKAKEAKKFIEEKQRQLQRERESSGETWVPKHFKAAFSKDGGWQCSPIHRWVPPAPIVFTP